jgi:uncharacterized protein (UPF0332 family)
MELHPEIKEDLERAHKVLGSAQRNFEEGDILTAANRLFVACESAVYAFLKLEYGSVSMSREKILTRLKGLDKQMKDIYDKSYDLRVQADYGRVSKQLPLTKENVQMLLANVTEIIQKVDN